MLIRKNIIILIFIILSACCNPSDNAGFNLQIFNLSSSQLEDMVKDISLDVKKYNKKGYTSIMELNRYDSIPEFWFSYQLNENINNYIFNNNKRIVGYLNYNDVDFLLLSNINNKSDFEMFFYKFVIPTKEKKKINYLYFPGFQYTSDETGNPLPPVARDQGYIVYAHIDGRIENVTSERWIYKRIFSK